MIAIALIKQQALDADLKVIHQISFTEKLDQVGNTPIIFIIEETKDSILDLSQRTMRVL